MPTISPGKGIMSMAIKVNLIASAVIGVISASGCHATQSCASDLVDYARIVQDKENEIFSSDKASRPCDDSVTRHLNEFTKSVRKMDILGVRIAFSTVSFGCEFIRGDYYIIGEQSLGGVKRYVLFESYTHRLHILSPKIYFELDKLVSEKSPSSGTLELTKSLAPGGSLTFLFSSNGEKVFTSFSNNSSLDHEVVERVWVLLADIMEK